MQRPEPPEPIQSNQSAGEQIYFRDGRYAYGRFDEQSSGGSRDSSSCFLYTFDEQSSGDSRDPSSALDSVFEVLEQDLITFVKKELRRFRRLLNPDYPKCIQDEDVLIGDKEWRSCREALLSTTLHFLRRMQEVKLAERLSNRTAAAECRHKIKHDLQKKFQSVFREMCIAGNPPLLNQNYTEVHITEGGATEVDKEHEVREIEAASRKPARPQTTIRQKDIFKDRPESHGPIRTVLTKGVAGIGKTVLTQRFSLDWAEDRANEDIVFIFPFTFRELNLLKDKEFSLVKLVHHFFAQTKEAGICSFEDFLVVFIFDGLDECRLPLDFHNNEPLTDVTVSTSVDVLLTNLIRGNLLPSARLWITTRPATARHIPPEYVSMVTEVRGFTDPQKEAYFRQRFTDNEQARRIISHIKRSRSLHTMCHIPVFCWISASVLEDMLSSNKGELPKTLTDTYIHFLLVQTNGGTEKDRLWNPENRRMIMSLGKLAFEQLQKGNLIFYESDLTGSGLDISAPSVCSGVFTKIFRAERGLYQDKVFSFVHFSLQEFLAALHVHLTFIGSDLNLLTGEQTSWWSKIFTNPFKLFYQQAVTEALKSPHGHLDLLLRFLLGLSLETNQTLLRGLVTKTPSGSEINEETVKFIKKAISEDVSPERSINLFHCMNELNDGSLVAKTQQQLRSGHLFKDKLSPAQWSALVFILLSPEEDLNVFDLKKYSASEEALLRLLPVVRASSKALLSDCQLSERSCEALSSVLSSKFSNLTELDLSHNDLQDSGVRLLSAGLRSRHCHLQTLRLSGCRISEEGCSSLALALRCNSSHLRELDLSYNHPGDSGVNLFSAGLTDPRWRLDTLRVDHGGVRRLNPGVRKYFFPLILDGHTVHKLLKLSNNNTTVTRVEVQQSYADHPDRFDYWTQLMCGGGLTGRCYWEVEWRGDVYISVSYGEIKRKGDSDSRFGCNCQSWSLICSDARDYVVLHNNEQTPIRSSIGSHRAAVYVDCDAGTLSFYSISSSDALTHLHTFHTTFTHTLYPGFRICRPGSSVCVCL